MNTSSEDSGPTPRPELRPDPVFIIGMHRSGTSAVSGALEKLGLSVGKTVMPPHAENPKGYFENLALTLVHDHFLNDCKYAWLDARPVRAKYFRGRRARRYQKQLLETVIQEFGSARPLVKDPRLCAILPLWRPLIKRHFPQASFVLPIRSPLEVASSLRQRDNMTLSHGLALWAVHVLEGERATRGLTRAFTTYEELLQTPYETMEKLARQLHLPTENIAAALDQRIDPKLRHHAEIPWPETEPDREIITAVHQTLSTHGPGMELALDRLRRQYYLQKQFPGARMEALWARLTGA
ncbi:MAG TPA: sulfotransferase [Verrucomicrobiae bacterium]|nr:sulfotransferase [Verrucomicrobiae bacterium]